MTDALSHARAVVAACDGSGVSAGEFGDLADGCLRALADPATVEGLARALSGALPLHWQRGEAQQAEQLADCEPLALAAINQILALAGRDAGVSAPRAVKVNETPEARERRRRAAYERGWADSLRGHQASAAQHVEDIYDYMKGWHACADYRWADGRNGVAPDPTYRKAWTP